MPEYRGVRAIAGILQKEWALREILHPHPVDVLATRLISDVAVPGVSASDLAIKMRTAPACELLLFFNTGFHFGSARRCPAQGSKLQITREADSPAPRPRPCRFTSTHRAIKIAAIASNIRPVRPMR